ncbi:Solute carrier family 28 member 3 [Nymphon striatum]|nr:Solute carrier family 28 member 3 [Nymphon striatum]
MKEKMWKYFSANSTRKYIDVLDEMVKNYNNTIHRSIKMTPLEASKKINEKKVLKNLYPLEEIYEFAISSNGGENEDGLRKSFIRKSVSRVVKKWEKTKEKHFDVMKFAVFTCLFVLYNVYVGFAINHDWYKSESWCDGSRFLVLLTILAYTMALYHLFFIRYVSPPLMTHCGLPMSIFFKEVLMGNRIFKIILYLIPIVGVTIFLVFDSADDRKRLISAGGVLVLTALGFIFSKHPTKVKWRPVIWGLLLQFIFGLMILRWSVGQSVFKCLGDNVSKFLSFTDAGSKFIFGYLVTGNLNEGKGGPTLPEQDKLFAFKVLPVIIFFSFSTSILYHYGIMQVVVKKIGWLLSISVGTTAVESLNAAGNIFVGQTEAPLLIAPFLKDLTNSELHAVMTGGFATIAGTVLAAYINFGVDPTHLLSASVMSAPAALGFSKLFYPETEQSRTLAEDIQMDKGTSKNALEAGAKGSTVAISLIANIASNLIAFMAFIAFMDCLLMWFGAYIMGVEWDDCEQVAILVGLKTIVNEFVAYAKLRDMTEAKSISKRSQIIATYALCGFSNLSSIGIQLGGLGAIAPSRTADLAKIGFRAMIAGSIACFLTACIAGALIQDPSGESAFTNTTDITEIFRFQQSSLNRPTPHVKPSDLKSNISLQKQSLKNNEDISAVDEKCQTKFDCHMMPYTKCSTSMILSLT